MSNVTATFDRLVDAIRHSDSIEPSELSEWVAALEAAGPLAVEVLACHGAISEQDRFFECVNAVANAGWRRDASAERFDAIVRDALQTQTHTDKHDRITEAAYEAERAKWQGAYALGLTVGILFAGGVR